MHVDEVLLAFVDWAPSTVLGLARCLLLGWQITFGRRTPTFVLAAGMTIKNMIRTKRSVILAPSAQKKSKRLQRWTEIDYLIYYTPNVLEGTLDCVDVDSSVHHFDSLPFSLDFIIRLALFSLSVLLLQVSANCNRFSLLTNNLSGITFVPDDVTLWYVMQVNQNQ